MYEKTDLDDWAKSRVFQLLQFIDILLKICLVFEVK